MLLSVDKTPLAMDALRSAFQHEHTQRHSVSTEGSAIAMRSTTSSTPAISTSTQGSILSEEDGLRAFATSTGQKTCWVCDSPDHLIFECPRRNSVRESGTGSYSQDFVGRQVIYRQICDERYTNCYVIALKQVELLLSCRTLRPRLSPNWTSEPTIG